MNDAKMEAAAESQFDSIAYGGLEYIRGGATHKNVVDAFIAGAKWQADQYTEALQLMREMAQALHSIRQGPVIPLVEMTKFEMVERVALHSQKTAQTALEKYRASRWAEGK